MFDSRGLPSYPPAQNAWQFPPPPVSPRWRWVAIAAMVFSLIAGATMLTIAIAAGSASAPGLIDDSELISVIESECDQMTTTVESLPIHGSASRQAQSILEQNAAVIDMVRDIREEARNLLTSDPPSNEWLTDWDRLVEARKAYAQEILLGGTAASFDIPTDEHGNEIDLRMNDAFLGAPACEVPSVLLEPYSDGGSDA
ncbi:hypothetical protein [Aeromicrobium sp. 9AM]|uniref:hypothetical protein n=1 Tax=Aeromicrobium sp. 9AM TaxID=2653126 RepID=UPI0012F1D5E2|nr:hypothetical protein [Aeromicrobium sp. 9AM]VXB32784.1 conserved hypothetical protein [Aeromicrobium sp. 9AM]